MIFKKGMIPWNKGLTRETDKRLDYERPAVFKKGEHRSPETEFKSEEMKIRQLGKNNPMWKGDSVGEKGVHSWIVSKLGKAKEHKCKCGKQAQHWSNKDHSYKRKLEDYTAMCASCHMRYDYKYNNRTRRTK